MAVAARYLKIGDDTVAFVNEDLGMRKSLLPVAAQKGKKICPSEEKSQESEASCPFSKRLQIN